MLRATLGALAALALLAPSVLVTAGGGASVSMHDLKFDPQVLTIHAGDTVTWSNDDAIEHTVTLDGVWDSSELWPGDSYARTFDLPGPFPYRCVYHFTMVAAVVVEP